jgi:hypothetical protein
MEDKDVLTQAFRNSLKPVGLMFPKSIPKKKKTMIDYAMAKKRIVSRLKSTKKEKGTLTLKKLKYLYNKVKKYDSDPTIIWVKKSKPKLHKKINIKKLREDCVTLAKKVAKARDHYIDQRSGLKVEGLNAHGSHIIPVSAGNALKYDTENIICLSYHNHINWWHKNPLEASEWFKTKFPKRYKYLQSKKNNIVKYTVEDLQAIKIKLEKQLTLLSF